MQFFNNNKYIHNNEFIYVKYIKKFLIFKFNCNKIILKKYTKHILFY